jgi:predicted porin
MKKLVVMAALAVAAISASAVEVGVRGTFVEGAKNDMYGVTVGQSFGKIGATASFDRSTQGVGSVNQYGVTGSYDLLTVGELVIAPTVGVAFVDPSAGSSGSAMLVGVGASYPFTAKVSLTANYVYQKGINRVSGFDGNKFMLGAKYSF